MKKTPTSRPEEERRNEKSAGAELTSGKNWSNEGHRKPVIDEMESAKERNENHANRERKA